MSYLQPIDFNRPPGTAMARAYELDRRADRLLAEGRATQAERLSHKAAEVRATYLAPEQLSIQDERRLRLGVEHAVRLGDRAVACLVVQVARERRDIAGLLDLLDDWRDQLSTRMVRGVGGDRFPHRELRAVPR